MDKATLVDSSVCRTNSRFKKGLSALAWMFVVGCAATQVGTTGTIAVPTKMLAYGPPGMNLYVQVYSSDVYGGQKFSLSPDSTYDNHASRPAGIPANYIAYVSQGIVFDPTLTYTGDLLNETSYLMFEHLDTIDPWTGGGTLLLIH